MKTTRLEKFYAIVLMVILGGIVLHAPLSVGFGVLFPDYSLLIKSWKEILMVGLVPLAIVIVSRRRMWQELFGDWLFKIIIAYALLHLLLVGFLYQGLAATVAGLAIDLRYVLFFGLVYVAVKALPHYRRRMLLVATIGACIVVGFATLQLFLPADILTHIGYSKDTIVPYMTVDKNPDYIRVNSTLRGPNPLGAYAGMVLGLLTAVVVRAKLQLHDKKTLIMVGALAVCSFVALWVSYSRSALVAGLITVAVVVFVSVARKLSKKAWIISAAVLCAVLGGLVVSQESAFVSNVLLHENPDGGSAISSNDDHAKSLETGLDALIRQPFGGGVGSTGSASLLGDSPIIIENQYLFIAHETGWLGVVLFVALFGMILLRLWHGRADWLCLGVFASGIGLGLIGLLLPVWADDTVSIVWWGLAAVALGGGNYARKQAK